MWTGLGIGAVTGLLGWLYGLWQRNKGADARALATLLNERLETERSEHKRTLVRAEAAAQAYVLDIESRKALNDVCQGRLEETVARHVADANDAELLLLANRVFPPPPSYGD